MDSNEIMSSKPPKSQAPYEERLFARRCGVCKHLAWRTVKIFRVIVRGQESICWLSRDKVNEKLGYCGKFRHKSKAFNIKAVMGDGKAYEIDSDAAGHVTSSEISPDDFDGELKPDALGVASIVSFPMEPTTPQATEAPHPMLCVHHGGSRRGELSNARNKFTCAKCFADKVAAGEEDWHGAQSGD